MLTFLLATKNRHKVGEIKAILGPDIRFLTLDDVPGVPHVDEDRNSFAGNATKKAVQLANWLRQADNRILPAAEGRWYCLADDSGLEVDHLNGAPGVHSARFAALDAGTPGNSSDQANNEKLLRLLTGVAGSQRTARFHCVIALVPVPASCLGEISRAGADAPELSARLFEGTCDGSILFEPRGAGGFGYDPLFLPLGLESSFAEIPDYMKNAISHRSKALRRLHSYLADQRGGSANQK
jgi:XTP/dITP diphosphohydrolase